MTSNFRERALMMSKMKLVYVLRVGCANKDLRLFYQSPGDHFTKPEYYSISLSNLPIE